MILQRYFCILGVAIAIPQLLYQNTETEGRSYVKIIISVKYMKSYTVLAFVKMYAHISNELPTNFKFSTVLYNFTKFSLNSLIGTNIWLKISNNAMPYYVEFAYKILKHFVLKLQENVHF
jgi:hypothetical protein